MKGFKDSNNKFHPITDYKKGVRKSRDQSAKSTGVRMKRGTKIKNLTTERLRKFKGDTIFYDLDGKGYEVDHLWDILEGEGFDNDSQRNNWLKAKFGNVIEDEPVPFGKIRKQRDAEKRRTLRKNALKIKILQPKKKGRQDSFWYDEIAEATSKDGSHFTVGTVGDVRFMYKGGDYGKGNQWKVMDEISDDKGLAKIDFDMNDWYEVQGRTKNGRYIDFGDSYSESYNSAIEQLKDSIIDYENKEDYITVHKL